MGSQNWINMNSWKVSLLRVFQAEFSAVRDHRRKRGSFHLYYDSGKSRQSRSLHTTLFSQKYKQFLRARWTGLESLPHLHSTPARCAAAYSARGEGWLSVPGPSRLPGAVVHGGDGRRGSGAAGHRPRAAPAPDAQSPSAPRQQRAPPAGACTTGEEGPHGRLHTKQLISGEGKLFFFFFFFWQKYFFLFYIPY